MAKSQVKRVNRAKAIRDYYDSHPKAKPLQVSAELKKQGIEVSTQYISTIRSNSKKKKGNVSKPGRPQGKGTRATSEATPSRSPASEKQKLYFQSLVRLKEVTREFGGIPQTRAALDALEAITD
ncbi:hypothetical protein Pla52o_00470 [Novipirellula galeiformis]|uniref:Uncharacterized protein n=1 Tax=Novipirellula galeiformis TaxID=2528004 RepID=A0A5C6CRL7_9BACT|nr:hypothetical protein [Novipirellula galeiformis]TWU26194.1 hypothetical protein Pla52o_00470 [Novipirellula galeiformis]